MGESSEGFLLYCAQYPNVRGKRIRAGAAALLLSAMVVATGPASADGPAPAVTPEATALANSCTATSMQSLAKALPTTVTIRNVRNGPRFTEGTRFVAASDKLPGFCQVTGSFVTNPATGKTANFLATFPVNWNGKYLQLGCSGHCGQFVVSDPSQPAVSATYPGEVTDILRKGYAAFSTDEGHEGFTGGTWAIKGPGQVDDDAIEDFYYRADQVLAGFGKDLTRLVYGQVQQKPQTIARSYFNGCSGGGRDAFVAASYFPEQFDGIIGGSAYDGRGASFQFSAIPLATLQAPNGALTPELVQLLAPIVTKQCDGLDGVKDGLIQNPAACNFRPERDLPKCAGDKPGGQCFTKAQINTVSVALTAITDEKGRVVQPGFTPSDLQKVTFTTPKRPADPNAVDPFPNTDNGGLASGYWPLAEAFLKVFVHKNDPNFNVRPLFTFKSGGPGAITDYRAVVPSTEVARVESAARMGIGHFPANTDRFIQLNRKLLIWHNLSDGVLTPYMSINYYNALAARHGGYAKLQKNVRLFGVPGTAHCGAGGPGPNTFDALTALENWVEKGQAPDAIPAHLVPVGPPFGQKDFSQPTGRSMPLCAYPAMARYKGKGDVNDGSNWTCPAGDKSMLKMGESGRRAGMTP